MTLPFIITLVILLVAVARINRPRWELVFDFTDTEGGFGGGAYAIGADWGSADLGFSEIPLSAIHSIDEDSVFEVTVNPLARICDIHEALTFDATCEKISDTEYLFTEVGKDD